MGRRKDIKVVCIKDYTDWVSADHLIVSGITPETKDGTQNFLKFEKGKTYKCTEKLNCLSGAVIVYVDSKILHSIGGVQKGSDYPKHLYDLFYIKQGEVEDKRYNFKDYFVYLKN